MRLTALFLLSALLTGCAGFDTGRSLALDRGAEVADGAAQVAEDVLCRGITIGAWQRRYGQNEEAAAAWATLCSAASTAAVPPRVVSE